MGLGNMKPDLEDVIVTYLYLELAHKLVLLEIHKKNLVRSCWEGD